MESIGEGFRYSPLDPLPSAIISQVFDSVNGSLSISEKNYSEINSPVRIVSFFWTLTCSSIFDVSHSVRLP